MKKVLVKDLMEVCELTLVSGGKGVNKELTSDEVHRPGLEFTGYLDIFPKERIQVLGLQEIDYLNTKSEQEQYEIATKYIIKELPCIVVSRELLVPECFVKRCEELHVPLLRTNDKTMVVTSKINNFLQRELANEIGIHAVCVDVFGVGVLIRGSSGIGKSEVVLSLVDRGALMVADDLVILKQIGPKALIASSNSINKSFLALRGVGLINVERMYGSGSVLSETRVVLDIILTPWDENTYYDAIGAEEKKIKYMDIEIDHIELPVRPGRDLAVLIEVAAKNWKLKNSGYNAVDELYERIKNHSEGN